MRFNIPIIFMFEGVGQNLTVRMHAREILTPYVFVCLRDIKLTFHIPVILSSHCPTYAYVWNVRVFAPIFFLSWKTVYNSRYIWPVNSYPQVLFIIERGGGNNLMVTNQAWGFYLLCKILSPLCVHVWECVINLWYIYTSDSYPLYSYIWVWKIFYVREGERISRRIYPWDSYRPNFFMFEMGVWILWYTYP